ncbi:MAG TPA: baseplate J/gp47 family protein, partial [Flavobacteriales bacterium]|nr:baseplate J/gp47 family protein [Flavobacteriales bacterium]
MITIPTLQQLNTSIKTALETAYGIVIPTTGKSFLRALVAVQAGKLKEFYLAVANTQKNIFPDTADPESLGGTLERFGRVKLGRNPFPAVAAKYQVTITGSNGVVIPALTQWKSDDDALSPGIVFTLDNPFTMPGTSGTIQLRSLTPGLEGKLNISDKLTITAPIANIDSKVTVQSEITAPQAAETTEEYRTAILNSYRLEPQGGAGGDYRIWAADAQGVKTVYPYAKSGATGEIDLYVEAKIADSIDQKGTPSNAMLTAVKGVVEFNPDITLPLNERGRRP